MKKDGKIKVVLKGPEPRNEAEAREAERQTQAAFNALFELLLGDKKGKE